MRRRLLLGLVPSMPIALLGFGGCSDAPVELGLVMKAPQGLLDHSSVDLFVFDATLGKCQGSGHATVPKGDATQRFTLDKGGTCPPNISRCKTIQLDKDGSSKVFAVTAKDATGLIGEGCTVKAINQDPLEVEIQIKRVQPPACCNDGRLEIGEQCDSGPVADPDCSGVTDDDVCASDCRAKEILLSIDDQEAPNLKNGASGSKTNVSLAFGPPVESFPNALRAAFVNSDTHDAAAGPDINMRLLGEELYPITNPPSLGRQLTLPITCNAITGKGINRTQANPAIARVGDNMAVVYASDQVVNGTFDIFLTPQTAGGCVDAQACTSDLQCLSGVCDLKGTNTCTSSVQLNTATGADNPDIAEGPQGSALITWARGGSIYGRIWTTDGVHGTRIPAASDFLIASQAENAHVAGNLDGWKVVYDGVTPDDGAGIGIRAVDPSGKVGDALRVNVQRDGTQEQPDIAMLEDGTALVVWRSDGDIFFQRFPPTGDPFDGDQVHPLNTTRGGDRLRPAVAAAVGLGSFFAVAWETRDDSGVGNIAGRFVIADGSFGYNSVSGQNDEFMVTHPDFPGGDRHLPAVAIGGKGFVVIGWQDDSMDPDHHGVFVRRFPLPPFE